MIKLGLTVNARAVEATVEPRTHLADFVRDHLNLTGTHLGCEHGVCGACTLLLDGMPARSCITYAVACDGAAITTIEGLDADDIAIELRAAFSREHALQCGYCTPGMLISARDLVLRLPDSDEHRIRVALSGNLCRCTGYVGIIRAIRSVIEQRRARGIAPVPGAGRTTLGPVGAGHGEAVTPAALEEARVEAVQPQRDLTIPVFTPAQRLQDSFEVGYPPARVFEMFGDVAGIAGCLPGVSLTGLPTPERVDGAIRIKLGPVTAEFRGAARIERHPADLSGRIIGIGRDQRRGSSTQGEIVYRLHPIKDGAATRVELVIGYSLRGMLAQVARAGLVRDLAARLTAEFARNLDSYLAGAGMNPAPAAQDLNVFTWLLHLFRERAREMAQRFFQR